MKKNMFKSKNAESLVDVHTQKYFYRMKILQQTFLIIIVVLGILILNNKISYAIDENIGFPEKTTTIHEYWLSLSDEERKGKTAPTDQEGKQKIEILQIPEISRTNKATTESLPLTYNLRDYIDVRVKDQKSTSSCWTFSALSVLESLLALKYGEVWDFSERHIDFSTSTSFIDAEVGLVPFNREVDSGGSCYYAMAYYTSGVGPILETDMPFSEDVSEISINEVKNKVPQKQVEEWVSIESLYLEQYEDEMYYWYYDENGEEQDYTTREGEALLQQRINTTKQHIMENGAIYTSVYIGDWDTYLNTNKCAYYCPSNYDYETEEWIYSDHAVSIIGWDDNYPKTNFNSNNQPVGDGAWIVLSSWGEGEEGLGITSDGVFYLSYYDAIINSKNAYGIVATSDIDYDNLYQYDVLGYTKAYKVNNSYFYGANVFTKQTTDVEYLTEVSIASFCDVEYEIYVNKIDGTFDTSKFEKVAESTGVETSEYFTVHLEAPVKLKGNEFVVAVKYIKADDKLLLTLEKPIYSETEETENDLYRFATSNEGESYIGTSLNYMKDLYEYGYNNANLCIKAFTIDSPLNLVESVTLPPTLELERGETAELIAEITPTNATDKEVVWESDNPNVAIVDENGTVTAVGVGIAVITVTTEEGLKTATCTVTVTEPIILVTNVILNKTTLKLEQGKTETLVAEITPTNATNKSVEWGSDNPNVVTVDENGTVTAVGVGTAVITVTTEDGLKTATCTVTVTEPIILVTNVILNKTTLKLEQGKTETLVAEITPTNATNKSVEWKSSNPSVVTVDENGKVTAVGVGRATVTVVTKDGIKMANCIVIVEKVKENEEENEKENEKEENNVENLEIKIAEEINYIINDENTVIIGIIPQTTVKTFLSRILTNAKSVKVYNSKGEEINIDTVIGTESALKIDNKSYILSVIGDLNGDGAITAVDLSKMKLRLVGLQTLSKYFEIAADINYNNSLTAADLSILKQVIIGTKVLTDTK